jgi:hypothetical protein
MREPREGRPHKPDDLTLVVFSRRGMKRAAKASVEPAASVEIGEAVIAPEIAAAEPIKSAEPDIGI